MNAFRRVFLLLAMALAASGCVTPQVAPVEPAGVSSQVRKEIHRLAVRGPNPPKVSLTSDLDGKGAATGKAALGAGMGWLLGTADAAFDAGEGGALLLAFGVVTAPIAAAGGAVYGATGSDTRKAIAEGNRTLTGVVDFAPDHFRQVLEKAFAGAVPVDYEFTGNLSDTELAAKGFDSVIDIQMDSLMSATSDNRFQAYFDHTNRVELRVFGRPDLTRSKTYGGRLPDRAVSAWAKDGGRQLLSDLDASYAQTAEDIVEHFFNRKSVRVSGIEPVSKGWGTGTISGTVPMFVWSARDGAFQAGPEVDYEVLVYTGRRVPESGVRTSTSRYVPANPLQACKSYRWQVRAHYESFGQPAQSEWSPIYRFRTPCRKPDERR